MSSSQLHSFTNEPCPFSNSFLSPSSPPDNSFRPVPGTPFNISSANECECPTCSGLYVTRKSSMPSPAKIPRAGCSSKPFFSTALRGLSTSKESECMRESRRPLLAPGTGRSEPDLLTSGGTGRSP